MQGQTVLCVHDVTGIFSWKYRECKLYLFSFIVVSADTSGKMEYFVFDYKYAICVGHLYKPIHLDWLHMPLRRQRFERK